MSPPGNQKHTLVYKKISYISPKYIFFVYILYILSQPCTVLPEGSNYLEAEDEFSYFDHRRHKGCEHFCKPRP